jgi:hypothetical protein
LTAIRQTFVETGILLVKGSPGAKDGVTEGRVAQRDNSTRL